MIFAEGKAASSQKSSPASAAMNNTWSTMRRRLKSRPDMTS
eukprot:CAMPEP_0115720298 /NCGR_PEP_ID=MMETSP0272-20121206/78466_1 /TAXON_ID=71861 /ORGANISM="Scrippsiella trochoidea, Strain CCMP3099" /LENGTH=40 /DNA_ID= /DNA_START= /DNA_END= /DNA_ORIENTATION=